MDKLNGLCVSKTNKKEIKNFVKQLKSKCLYFFDIPAEFRNHPLIVSTERECGIRRSVERGYDVVRNCFFVHELVLGKNWTGEVIENQITTVFDDFTTYFEFLQGDIYENACYYKYCFNQEENIKYSIDDKKINFKSLINYDIDEYTLDFSQDEINQYKLIEKRKNVLKKWIDRFNDCCNFSEFKRAFSCLSRSKYLSYYKIVLYSFIFNKKDDAFEIIMKFINSNYSLNNEFELGIEKSLCFIFNPKRVIEAYNPNIYNLNYARQKKRKLDKFVKNLECENLKISSSFYFEENTHTFICCYKVENIIDNTIETIFRLYFQTFEEFAKFKNNDLSYCDLSKAVLPNIDWSQYKINDHTKLPIQYLKNFSFTLNKIYDRQKDCFVVEQTWTDKYGNVIKYYKHLFKYFFDFVHFLKNNLSDADLLYCDGLKNITDFNDLNLNGVRLQSNVLDSLGLTYELAFNEAAESFSIIQKNETATENALIAERLPLSFEETLNNQKIFYISDLHLLHRLENANCKSLNDAICVIQKIIDNLLKKVGHWEKNIILIGGDTASNLSLFELFIKTLRTSIDEKNLDVQVVFTLGNHELWDFSGTQLSEIVKKYRKLLTDNKMYLLQNNLLFKYDWNSIEEISTDELKRLSKEELRNCLLRARLILFGGIGFAGYNEEFNANKFIYRRALNRQQEIEESKKFEELYEKVCECLYKKRVVVFTHMPQKDWCSHNEPHKGFVYVNGHTHRNLFYDDGDYRIYADNQIGYHQENCRLKYFYLEDDYDIFEDCQDAIYEITREEYIDFYRGKNIAMDFNRDGYNIFMLKKSGYYCFIAKSNKGYLLILNGGNLKRLEYKDINYYFENMDKVISYIKTPLDKFTDYQKQIANEIKAIGGSGIIHGAIIDIDFFNHIFVNPLDLKTTSYWASDIVNKIIFNDTPTLLQHNCPTIYANYLKLIESKSENAIILKKSEIIKTPQIYLDTDIYRASMEIKKMQKLSSNILSIWIEPEVKKLSN